MNKKGMVAFLLVIIVSLAVLGIYLISKNKSGSSDTPIPPPKIADVFDGSTTTTSPKLVFSNPTGGYSFQYSPDWKVAINEARASNTLFGPDASGSAGLGGVEISEKNSFYDNDGEWINKEPITVDGVTGSRMQYKGTVNGEAVVLMTQNVIYNIYINSEKEEDLKLFDEIIASFKFTKRAELNTDGYKYTYEYKTDTDGMVKGQKLVFLSPGGVTSSVPGLMALQIDLATRVHANGLYENTGEDITSFDMPISPFDKNIIFLSTAEPLEAPKEGLLNNNIILNRIYTYNLQTSELIEVYKKEVRDFVPEGAVMWRTVGIEENKLIILYDHMGNSPGVCLEIFYSYKDRFVYLDLENISAGLQTYTVDPDLVDAVKIRGEKCAAGL